MSVVRFRPRPPNTEIPVRYCSSQGFFLPAEAGPADLLPYRNNRAKQETRMESISTLSCLRSHITKQLANSRFTAPHSCHMHFCEDFVVSRGKRRNHDFLWRERGNSFTRKRQRPHSRQTTRPGHGRRSVGVPMARRSPPRPCVAVRLRPGASAQRKRCHGP